FFCLGGSNRKTWFPPVARGYRGLFCLAVADRQRAGAVACIWIASSAVVFGGYRGPKLHADEQRERRHGCRHAQRRCHLPSFVWLAESAEDGAARSERGHAPRQRHQAVDGRVDSQAYQSRQVHAELACVQRRRTRNWSTRSHRVWWHL